MSKTTLECLEWLMCATCGEKKPPSYFHQRASSKTGYAASCRPCINGKCRNKKKAPAGDSSRLKTLVKKGDLQNLQNLVEQTATRSFNSLLKTCVTPYISFPKTTAHSEVARYLIEQGADPNAEVDIGIAVTPLVACCQSAGTVAVVHALLRGGANPNQQQVLRSALRHCKNRRNPENSIADALIKSGGLVDAVIDEQNRTCLHLYSHHEEIQAVNWLLDAGASVHARTKDGRTPLHLAADRNNNTMVCTLLLAHGANSETMDTLGKRPVDYAQENHKTKIIALLDRQ